MTNAFSIEGSNIFVTGGSGGIGSAIVETLMDSGANIAAVDLSQDAVDAVAAQHQGGPGAIVALAADVTDPSQLAQAVERAEAELGPLNAAVNAAGINHQAPAEDMPLDVWQKTIDINLTGLFLSCQAEANAMIRHGGGAIVNIGSVSAIIANRGLAQANYNASKAGVLQLTSSLALEWADRKVRVNSVSPGYTKTRMVEDAWEQIKTVVDDIPAGRMAEPREIALAVQFLLSDASAYIVGENITVDGGHSKW